MARVTLVTMLIGSDDDDGFGFVINAGDLAATILMSVYGDKFFESGIIDTGFYGPEPTDA